MRMKLLNLKEHPENKHIYESCCVEDLKTSLNIHGQMEPIAITKNGVIISGHRRFKAMSALGWLDCDVRIVSPENELIALIEHNRYRQKVLLTFSKRRECLRKNFERVLAVEDMRQEIEKGD